MTTCRVTSKLTKKSVNKKGLSLTIRHSATTTQKEVNLKYTHLFYKKDDIQNLGMNIKKLNSDDIGFIRYALDPISIKTSMYRHKLWYLNSVT